MGAAAADTGQDNAPQQKKGKYPCIWCKKNVTKTSKSVKCACCELWVHVECEQITPELFSILSNPERFGGNVMWNCDSCTSSVSRLHLIVAAVQNEIRDVKEKVKENTGAISGLDKRSRDRLPRSSSTGSQDRQSEERTTYVGRDRPPPCSSLSRDRRPSSPLVCRSPQPCLSPTHFRCQSRSGSTPRSRSPPRSRHASSADQQQQRRRQRAGLGSESRHRGSSRSKSRPGSSSPAPSPSSWTNRPASHSYADGLATGEGAGARSREHVGGTRDRREKRKKRRASSLKRPG